MLRCINLIVFPFVSGARITGGDGGGNPPPLSTVIPGTKIALHVASPPLKMGWALKKYPFSMFTPLSTFLLIRALFMSLYIMPSNYFRYVNLECQ